MEGVVAKRRDSRYRPGSRDKAWVKVKAERTQEVVIGGWTEGNGSRKGTFGALLLGIPATPSARSLRFVGKVGTGFGDEAREALLSALRPLVQDRSPFDEVLARSVLGGPATWVRPKLVGEVRITEWTDDDHLRHPSWRGLRDDKRPKDVRRES
jgi:bifunctional non-homologous end joining protein LigD